MIVFSETLIPFPIKHKGEKHKKQDLLSNVLKSAHLKNDKKLNGIMHHICIISLL